MSAAKQFLMVTTASRGISKAFAQSLLRNTKLPLVVGARTDPKEVKEKVLEGLDVDEKRLNVVKLDITDESTIQSAAEEVKSLHPDSHLRLMLSSAGILFPEKSPDQLESANVDKMFAINVTGPLMLIKHFWHFLPQKSDSLFSDSTDHLNERAIWACMSARVGSTTDNGLGGWYAYRASKAAMNSVVKTFDLHLYRTAKEKAIAVALHPGTTKTDLSREFWESVERRGGHLFEPEEAADNLLNVLKGLGKDQRGKIWDWKGEEIKP